MDLQMPHRNIYIIGPQSTGKTTLVNALEKTFTSDDRSAGNCKSTRPAVIREVARNVLSTYNFTRDDITKSPTRALELQKLILMAQLKEEEAKLIKTPSRSWFISDRSGIDPIVYAQLFVGEEAALHMMASDEWKVLEKRMKNGLVILCEAGCTWLVDDGTRLMPKDIQDWLRVDSAFREMLKARGIDSVLMPKGISDIQQRVQIVLGAIHTNNNVPSTR